jgi:hypothetical protein
LHILIKARQFLLPAKIKMLMVGKIKVHIGKQIRQKMDEDGRKANWLAKQIGCDESVVTRMIYQKQHPASERVIKISILLKTDFFAHYSEYINEEIQKENPKI